MRTFPHLKSPITHANLLALSSQKGNAVALDHLGSPNRYKSLFHHLLNLDDQALRHLIIFPISLAFLQISLITFGRRYQKPRDYQTLPQSRHIKFIASAFIRDSSPSPSYLGASP